MESIYDTATLQEIIKRMDKLSPASQALWGKMNVSQMLAHCCAPVAVAVGDASPKTTLVGKLFGSMAKGMVVGNKPFKQNLPTDKTFLVVDARDFEKEKGRLTSLLRRFSQAGPEAMTGKKHPFFGNMNPEEWSTLVIKHMDHHLRQFGV